MTLTQFLVAITYPAVPVLPIPEERLKLVPPADQGDIWLFDKTESVVGFTEDGDILLPVEALGKCDALEVKSKKRR
jgi:hypothetical protein